MAKYIVRYTVVVLFGTLQCSKTCYCTQCSVHSHCHSELPGPFYWSVCDVTHSECIVQLLCSFVHTIHSFWMQRLCHSGHNTNPAFYDLMVNAMLQHCFTDYKLHNDDYDLLWKTKHWRLHVDNSHSFGWAELLSSSSSKQQCSGNKNYLKCDLSLFKTSNWMVASIGHELASRYLHKRS